MIVVKHELICMFLKTVFIVNRRKLWLPMEFVRDGLKTIRSQGESVNFQICGKFK